LTITKYSMNDLPRKAGAAILPGARSMMPWYYSSRS
jgi:hypothetical protein